MASYWAREKKLSADRHKRRRAVILTGAWSRRVHTAYWLFLEWVDSISCKQTTTTTATKVAITTVTIQVIEGMHDDDRKKFLGVTIVVAGMISPRSLVHPPVKRKKFKGRYLIILGRLNWLSRFYSCYSCCTYNSYYFVNIVCNVFFCFLSTPLAVVTLATDMLPWKRGSFIRLSA